MEYFYFGTKLKCMICKLVVDENDYKKLKQICFADRLYCNYCATCFENGQVKKQLLAYFAEYKMIPCMWAHEQKLNFYRSSIDQIVTGTYDKLASSNYINDLPSMITLEKDLKTSKLMLKMTLYFNAYHHEKIQLCRRLVSLANIFKHNSFYEKLTTCSNLMGSDCEVIISYQDLDDDLKKWVDNSSELSNNQDKFAT